MMSAMNLDVDCLRTFSFIAETMSFSQAAMQVHRSQSTVSQQINKLEEQVGCRLVARRKGRVLELTNDGVKFLPFVKRMLQLNDEAFASVSEDVLRGFVRLGVPLDFFGRDFTAWLARFKSLHPMVGLEVEANQSENLLKRTERGEFDLAFFKQDSGSKRGTVALREQLVWVVGKNAVPPLDRSLPLILFPEGCAYRRVAIDALKKAGIPWHISFVSPAFECLKAAVSEGLGITILARALVAPPMRIVGSRAGLPTLPQVELVSMYGKPEKSRVVTELANFLCDSLANAGAPVAASAA